MLQGKGAVFLRESDIGDAAYDGARDKSGDTPGMQSHQNSTKKKKMMPHITTVPRPPPLNAHET